MGVGVSRIEQEFILTAVQDKHIPMQIHGARQESSGNVTLLSESDVEITLDTPLNASPDDRVRVFFSYFGHVMTFSSLVKRCSDEKVTLVYPSGIYKHLQRKYERVPAPSETTVSFQLESTKVELHFPKTESYDHVEEPVASQKFNPESISKLISAFRTSVAERCTENTITMFRGREPSSLEERTMVRTGRILYIASTQESFPESEESLGGQIITKDMMAAGGNGGGASIDLESYLAQKLEAGIYAEIYCPVLFHEYIVGYAYLVSRDPAKHFDEELVRHVHEFARVLAYSLRINNYFEDMTAGPERFEPRIVDLSASGLLFAHDSSTLRETLVIYADLQLFLQIGDRRVQIASRVMRKYEDRNACYFGVQFLDMQPEDFRFLFDYVYGRKLTKEDSELWEGGAAPPPLEL